jgi:hypothetical protein
MFRALWLCPDVGSRRPSSEQRKLMKKRVLPLLILLCAGFGLQPASRAAAVSISAGIQINAVGDFYQPLSVYGSWVDAPSYGRCWHPARVTAEWRPYSQGHWEYTDVGWYWISDEPFGWATFHYGSWVNDPQYGWIWIPGIEWSPAWVVWRESDTYIGWAPCGPNLAVASPSLFVFVEAQHFCDPIRPTTVIVNNTRIINNTRIVNNFRSETRDFNGRQRRMRVNAGPDATRIQHATGRNFTPTPIRTAVERTEMRRANEQPQRGADRSTTRQDERTRERSTATPEQPARERSIATPEQQTRERSVTTPERPAVQDPSGAARERRSPTSTHEAPPTAAPRQAPTLRTPQEAPAPSARPVAPAPERPAVREPSGATRERVPSATPHEAPAPSTPHATAPPSGPLEEHRTVAPTEAPRAERPAVPAEHAPNRTESQPRPQREHAAPVQQGRENERDRTHDQQ